MRLLALDIDGTLAHRGDEILPATRDALRRAHAQGVEVVIATGRRYRTTRRVIDNLGLEVAAVSLGGAIVKEADGETRACRHLSEPQFSEVSALYQEAGLTAIGQRDGHADGGPDFVIDGKMHWNGWTSRYADANQEHCVFRPDLAAERRSDVIELCGFGRETELDALATEVHSRHPGRYAVQLMPLPASSAAGGGFFVEVRPAGICKWTGLQHLMKSRGLAAEQVCAVGDERNDLTMVEAAGMGVAMGNAHEALQRVADWTTGTCDRDGLVEVVERLLALADSTIPRDSTR